MDNLHYPKEIYHCKTNKKNLLLIFFFIGFLLFTGKVLAQEDSLVSISATNEDIRSVLDKVENSTIYRFTYKDVTLSTQKNISVSTTKMDIETFLNNVLASTPLTFKRSSNTFSIIPKTQSSSVQSKVEVKGKVSDENGDPLIGAIVTVKGSTIGTVTDIDGKFSLEVSLGALIEVSFIGYTSQVIDPNGKNDLKIVLQEDVKLLEEVVVVGYGTSNKRDLTGAIGVVSGDIIEKRQSVQVSNALQGAVAGVTVTRNSGAPGTGSTIRIRGNTTIGDNSALIIIDGIPNGDINNINPSDIESISILKDAAASSIYGSRAAAGVILVTTKRAKEGQAIFNYNYEYGIEKPTEMPEYVDVVRYMQLVNERQINDRGSAIYEADFINNYWENHLLDSDAYPATNWQDAIYKSWAPRHRHEFAMSMGTEKIKTKASFGYTNIDGLYANSNYERFMFRINNDINLHKMLSANLDASFKRTDNNSPADAYISSQSIAYRSRVMPGIYDDRYDDGRYAPGKDGSNPLAEIERGGINRKRYNQLLGRFVLDFKPVEGLSLKAIFAPTLNFNKYKSFAKTLEYTAKDDPSRVIYTSDRPKTTLEETRADATILNGQFLANYRKTFKNTHNLDVLFGYEENTVKSEGLKASREGFLITEFPYLDLGSEDFRDNSGNASESALRSFFGRINYNYKNRYYLQANSRYDGSSRFHKNSRWAFFPSFSAGWMLSEEKFMQNIPFLSYLKLRGSWGQVGNERIGNYPYQASITHYDALFWQNGEITSIKTGAQTVYAIQNITWETTESHDIGIDLVLLDQRLSITADYYRKKTKDILLKLDIPTYLGYDNPNQNAGKISTKGWELETSYSDEIGDFYYSLSFNISDAKTRIDDLRGTQLKGDVAKLEGGEFDEWYGYRAKGIYQNQEQVDNLPKLNPSVRIGDICYEDISGPDGIPDGIISDYDKVLLGGSLPRYTYGGNISMSYKNVDFSLSFQGVGKVKSRLSNVQVQPFREGGIGNVPKIIDGNFWSTHNTSEQNLAARYPRLSTTSASNNYAMSDFWLIDGSYFRLKNITIGYTIPIGGSLGQYVKNIRAYIAINDLFSIDKYPKGWDPESSATGYPIVTNFIGGVNLTF